MVYKWNICVLYQSVLVCDFNIVKNEIRNGCCHFSISRSHIITVFNIIVLFIIIRYLRPPGRPTKIVTPTVFHVVVTGYWGKFSISNNHTSVEPHWLWYCHCAKLIDGWDRLLLYTLICEEALVGRTLKWPWISLCGCESRYVVFIVASLPLWLSRREVAPL